MYVLSDTLKRGNNNFDLIRLFAALAVMLGHSYGIQGAVGFEAMILLTHLESFGSLAVYAFFMISGMLVSASYAANPRIGPFVVARAARIWPAVIVCSAVIAFVIGPVFAPGTLSAYISNAEVYRWFAHNASLIGRVGGRLAGLFGDNHAKFLVNATAWTLPVELKCYVLVLLAGLMGLMGSRWKLALFVVVAAGLFAYFIAHPVDSVFFGDVLLLPPAYSFYPVPFFLLGMILYSFRTSVVLSGRLVLVLLTGAVVLRYSRPGTVFFYLLFAYGLLWLSSVRRLLAFRPKHDYSYGIYLYGFVVQQSFAALFPNTNNFVSLAFTVPVAAAFAAFSWHVVERPALRWARKWKGGSKEPNRVPSLS